jgi:hypothetical protein
MEQKENIRLELIVHAYNTSYSGGGKDWGHGLRTVGDKKLAWTILMNKVGGSR